MAKKPRMETRMATAAAVFILVVEMDGVVVDGGWRGCVGLM